MPFCLKCIDGEPHTRNQCRDVANLHYCARCFLPEYSAPHVCINNQPVPLANGTARLHTGGGAVVIEGTGIITRIDRYTLSVDGVHLRATEDQERRIRALTTEQRADLLKILGRGRDATVGEDCEGVMVEDTTITNLLSQRLLLTPEQIRQINGFWKPIV